MITNPQHPPSPKKQTHFFPFDAHHTVILTFMHFHCKFCPLIQLYNNYVLKIIYPPDVSLRA